MKLRFLLHDVFTKGGGVLTVTFALAEDLAQRHEVEIVSLFGGPHRHPRYPADIPLTVLVDRSGRDDGPLRRFARGRPSRVMPPGDPRSKEYSLLTDWALRRHLRSLHGGAVVAMQPAMNIGLARLGTDDYVKVGQDHRPFVTRPAPLRDAYARYGARLDTVMTLTDEDAEHYRRLIPEARVLAMPNGAPGYDGPLSSLDEQVVVAAGRLEASKGFLMLIRAWQQVAHRHPDWSLRIFGEGTQRARLEDEVARLSLGSSVHLEGYTDSLPAELARAAFFVLSSKAEGYPMVLLEAMSCGLPLVSTDCPAGGPRDIIEPGVNGLLVPNQDVDAMARAIVDMIERGVTGRRAMGAAARRRAEEQSRQAVADRWHRMLTELAAGR